MLIPRMAAAALRRLHEGFPIIAVTGPRQSGKTTLVRALFSDKPYASLEDPDLQEFALSDPRGFLAQYPDGAVFDEAQRAPALFSYLQGVVDDARRTGMFVLTGSQQFGLLSGITQSLAGRAGMLSLLPFSLAELLAAGRAPERLDELIWFGAYPPVYDRRVEPSMWYGSYVQTYIERDVRQLINVRDLTQFQRFLRLCAGRTGQLLNLSTLGDDAGVSHNTARQWISVLEASYLVFRLAPQHVNFNKRLVKTPKLYFTDVGLAAWLLGIDSAEQIATHPLRGALFETWVVGEHLKERFNAGLGSNLTFWRDRSGHEVDLIVDRGGRLQPVEIKAGATIGEDGLRTIKRWLAIAGDAAQSPRLIYGGSRSFIREGVEIVAWRELA